MTEVWTKWEGQIINGVFPLRRFLSASDHSAVFLTEHKAQNLPRAALKLVPVIPALAQAQLSQWTTAAALIHPHLLRLLEAGRCQLEGRPFLFVVMDYAEQTLSQILPQRPLTSGEVREMLLPTLDALAFLHRNNLVQGQLKPSNILVIDDQLKLASDTVRPAGESTTKFAKSSVYDPPEAKDRSFSAAGDIWALGMTMVEALTQHLPSWPDGQSETASFPADLPPTWAEIARQCLNRNPANRPAVADVERQLQSMPPMPVVSVAKPAPSVPRPAASIPQPRVHQATDRAASPEVSPKRRLFVPAIAVLVIGGVAVWVGLHMQHSRPPLERAGRPTAASSATSQPAPPDFSAPTSSAKIAASKSSAPPRIASRPADQRTPPLARKSPAVLHEVIPDVPRRTRGTIHGRIKVAVRVTVDSSGNVVEGTLENPGPSKYFARLASEAARKWKFVPADDQGARKWLLQFEFTRSGTTGRAVPPK
jgi:TonB family protein